MAGESSRQRISDLISRQVLAIGDGYRAKNSEMSLVGLPFARAGNVNGGFSFDDADLIDISEIAVPEEKLSRPGDTVFTSKGTVGRFAFVKNTTQQFVYSPQLCYWRSLNNKIIDQKYLYYWLCSPSFYAQYKGVSGQTDMAEYVSLGDQRQMWITLPDPVDQTRIGEMLGLLDDKIEVNRCMAARLEAIARALFKSWFLDFDPVWARTKGRDPGLSDETAVLFPSRFKQGLPEDWGFGSISSILDINPSTPLRSGIPAPYADMAALPTSGPTVSGHIMRDASSGSRFRQGDTLVARITPCLENGKTALVDFLPEDQVGWGSTEFIVLRPKAPMSVAWPYLLARNESFRAHLIGSMTGSSGRQRVPHSAVSAWKMALPPPEILEAFSRIVDPLFSRIQATAAESQVLRDLRDTLLPKLISGELRINDAEKAVAA